MKFNLSEENVNYVKITYADKENFSHCIKSAVRLIGGTEILVSTKFEEDVFIPVPQDVDIGIACDNGLYKAHTVLRKVEFEDPYTLLSLKKPEEVEFQQNREYFRVKIQENAIISYENGEEQVKLSALTYDLSAKGVRIEIDEEIDFPAQVTISLFFQNKIIVAPSEFIRNDNEDNILKASFRFTDISQSDLDFISQVCFKKQIEDRRKNFM